MVEFRDVTTAALLVDAISLAQRERVKILKGLDYFVDWAFTFAL